MSLPSASFICKTSFKYCLCILPHHHHQPQPDIAGHRPPFVSFIRHDPVLVLYIELPKIDHHSCDARSDCSAGFSVVPHACKAAAAEHSKFMKVKKQKTS